MQSFHLELAVTRIVQERPSAPCLDRVTRAVEILPRLLVPRQFPDRADSSRCVDEYIAGLSDADRRLLTSEFESARRQWNVVLAAGTPSDIMAALAEFFGLEARDLLPVHDARAAPRLPRGITSTNGREAGEQFLSDSGIVIRLSRHVSMNADVSQKGFRTFRLRGTGYPLKKHCSLDFFIESCDVPKPFIVKWKVKNTGAEAAARSALRGEITDDAGVLRKHEITLYWGNHYVECYIIKDGVCVAADHIDVPIGRY